MTLTDKFCVPCQGGIPPLTRAQADALLGEVPGWTLSDDASRLRRDVKFQDFLSAAVFAQHVAELAEEESHHPDICFGWGYCTLVVYTHKIKGLHENDFILAAKINALLETG